MRKTFVLVLLLLALPSLAFFSIGARVGYLMPLGEYGDTFSGGFTGGLKFDLGILPFLDTSLNVTYVEGTVKENSYGIPTTEMNSIVPVFLQAKLKLPGFVAPYVLAGLGLYFYSLEYDNADTGEHVDETGAKFGYNAGLGVEVSFLGFMGAYADGTYHWADTEPATINSLTFQAGVYVGF
jgi:hypothetical protein